MIAPINMARILNHPKLDSFNLSSLKWIFIGGSSVPTSTINQVHVRVTTEKVEINTEFPGKNTSSNFATRLWGQ